MDKTYIPLSRPTLSGEFPHHPLQSIGSRVLPSALFAEEDVMEQDKFVVFESWLLGNGAKFPKLELRV